MKKKTYDEDKTYRVEFKDEKAEADLWIHIHCLMAYERRSINIRTKGKSDDAYLEYIRYLKNRMFTVYQLMSLYRDASPGHWQQAYGGFLNMIQDLDSEALKYFKITELKEGEKGND